MALSRMPREERAATLRIVAPSETAAPQSDWTGRVGALSALARPMALRRAVRILSYALSGALIGALLLVAAATAPVLFGYHTYVIEGSSMAPSLKAGSVAVTGPTSPRALKVGDIVARRSSTDSPPVLHRIVEVQNVDGQRLFITQGDANRSPDPQPVALEGPGDKVIYSVPYAGYILGFAGSGLGRGVLIGVPLVLLAAIFVRERRPSPAMTAEAGAEAGTRTDDRASSRNIVILKTRGEDYVDLPVFLLKQLQRLPGLEGGRWTDSQRQQEERLAA